MHGASRNVLTSSCSKLSILNINERVHLHSATLTDHKHVTRFLEEIRSDEVYNLAGQSSLADSIEKPIETLGN